MIQFFTYAEAKQMHEERVARAMARNRRRAARRARAHPEWNSEAELIEIDFALSVAPRTKMGA